MKHYKRMNNIITLVNKEWDFFVSFIHSAIYKKKGLSRTFDNDPGVISCPYGTYVGEVEVPGILRLAPAFRRRLGTASNLLFGIHGEGVGG